MTNYRATLYKRTVLLFALIYIVFISIYGCGNKNNSDNVRGEDEVWIKNASFIPDTLNIPVGTTVTWINQDSVSYTVTSEDSVNSKILFNSGKIPMNGTFNYTFNISGVYHYICKIHTRFINGIVIVQ